MCTHIRGVRNLYSFPSETDDIDKKIMQSSNGRRWAEFQRVVLLPRFIQQQLWLIPFMEKKLLRYKVNRPVRFHILSVTLHSPVPWEDEFFSKYIMYNNARGTITILSPYRKQ